MNMEVLTEVLEADAEVEVETIVEDTLTVTEIAQMRVAEETMEISTEEVDVHDRGLEAQETIAQEVTAMIVMMEMRNQEMTEEIGMKAVVQAEVLREKAHLP